MTTDKGGEGVDIPAPLAGIRWFDQKVQRVEVAVCLGSLTVMILLAFTQVFLRLVQGSALGAVFPDPVPWFENVARHMVIWVGVLGASLATAEGRHISIEALPKLLSRRGQRRVDILTNLIALSVVGIMLLVCSVYLYRLQLEPWLLGRGEPLFSIQTLGWEIPRWPFLAIVPVGLLVISWRFGLRLAEAAVLEDATYEALRELDEQQDIIDVDEQQEPDAVELLTDIARRQADEQGTEFALDQDTARAEVREVLKSDRYHHEDLLAGPESESDEQPSSIPSRRRPISLRSTDEIPTYRAQDLHDDEDVRDPVMRKGDVILDSTDMINVSGEDISTHDTQHEVTPHVPAPPTSEVGDIRFSSDDPDTAVEALADSERRKESERRKQWERDHKGDDPTAITERVPVELPPAAVPARLVVLVRPRGEDA